MFSDRHVSVEYDISHSINEDRWVLIGMSSMGRLLTVAYGANEYDKVIRIIAARRSTQREARRYEAAN